MNTPKERIEALKVNGYRFIEHDETIKAFEGEIVMPFTEFIKALTTFEAQIREQEREKAEVTKLASNIALMKILVERGSKGDMERLIQEYEERLVALFTPLPQDKEEKTI